MSGKDDHNDHDDDGRTRIGALPDTDAPSAAEDGEAAPEDDRTQISVQDEGSAPLPLAQPATGRILDTEARAQRKITIGMRVNNNYEITRILKSGGMGEVYRGVEIGTGDPVALKAILPELAEDEKAGLLFKREARTLRQLSDEAIVRYYNYVHDLELDRYFLVMEFVEGVTLSDHLEHHGAIPPGPARTLMARLARGLSKAHKKDVVHRDLSPDNVMLPGGSVAEARLIDFGIAKSSVVTEGTMHGQFAGKFKYVAPEQLGHYDGNIGPATDIYGLALLMAAAVIGKPLDMGSSIVEAVQSRQKIPDLSAASAELRPLLAWMLEPDPIARPTSMEEVLRILANLHLVPAGYHQGQAIPAPPAGEGAARPPIRPGTVPGLQVPGSAFAQPFAPGSAPTQTTYTPLGPAPEGKRARSGGVMLLAVLGLVFISILGGGVYAAWQQGMINFGEGGTSPTPAKTTSSGIPAPDLSTRDGFLAGLDTGPCTYVSRITSGPDTGLIAGFSASGDSFAGLPAAYEEKFGARPEVLPRTVALDQCAALDFVRALEGWGRAPITMQLSTDTVTSGDILHAQIAMLGENAVWTVLISPTGGIYNLTERLSDPVDGRRSLDFGLTLSPGAKASPQLLLSVATQTPLAKAAAASDGVQAKVLLPALLDEIAARDGAATAALSWVMLTPPADPAE